MLKLISNKISKELIDIINNKPVKLLPILITLVNNADHDKIFKCIVNMGIHINLFLSEPRSIISCDVSIFNIKKLTAIQGIEKLEYDGMVHAS